MKKSKKRLHHEKIFQLYDSITSLNEINCDICREIERLEGDLDYAMEEFYAQGWRTRRKTYCPKCAKKKLKTKD